MTTLPQRGEATILFKDSTLKIKFSFQSMARMEERMGVSLTTIMVNVSKMELKIKHLVDILYEGAMEMKQKPDYDAIGNLVVENGIHVISGQMIKALVRVLTSGKEEVPSGEEVKAETKAE